MKFGQLKNIHANMQYGFFIKQEEGFTWCDTTVNQIKETDVEFDKYINDYSGHIILLGGKNENT
jgi:hypothetical protein